MTSEDFEFRFQEPTGGYVPSGMDTGEDRGEAPKFDWESRHPVNLTTDKTGFGRPHQRAPSPLRSSSPPPSQTSQSQRKRSARQVSRSSSRERPESPVLKRSESPIEVMQRGIKFIRTLSGQILTQSGDQSPTSSRASSPVSMDRSRSPSPTMDVSEDETQLNEEIVQRAKGDNGIFKKLADGSKFKNDLLAIFDEIEKMSPLSAELEARLKKALDRLENYSSRRQINVEEEELIRADFLWAAGKSELALDIYQKHPERLNSSERADKMLPKDQLEKLLRIKDGVKNLEPKEKALQFYRFCIDQAFAGATRKGSPRSPTAENPTTSFLYKAVLVLQTMPQELLRLNTSQVEMNIKMNESFQIVYKADKIFNQLPDGEFKQQLVSILQEIFKRTPWSADEILKLDKTLDRLDAFCRNQQDGVERELLRADLLFIAGKRTDALRIYQGHNDILVSRGRADKRIAPEHFELLKQVEKCALRQEPKDKAAKFYEFCVSHALSQQASASKVSPQEASRRMTKFLSKALMVLAERPQELFEIDFSKATTVTSEIEHHFSGLIQKIAQSVVKQNQELMALLNKEPKLSNPAAASEIAFARALTKILFIDGKLNTGIIPTIQRILLREAGQSALRDHMKFVLDQFFHSHELCQQLHSTKSPSNERAELFVRTTLQKPVTQPLTETDACEAVFVNALLLHRQHDEIASCYATACLVQASVNDFPSFFKSVKEVVEDGVITIEKGGMTRGSQRTTQRTTAEFLAAPYMAVETMKTNEDKIVFKIQLPSGKIGSVHAYDLPAIKSMCDSLGIPKEGFNEFLIHLSQKGKTLTLTPPELLGHLVDFLISPKGIIKVTDKDKTIKLATFAIEACHQAPVLRALENSIIAMAQGDPKVNDNLEAYREYFKESVTEAIVRTLSFQFPKVPEEKIRSIAKTIVDSLPLQNIGFFAHPPTEHLYLYFKDQDGGIHEIRDMASYLNLAADLLVSICQEKGASDKSGALLYLTTDGGKNVFKEQLRSAVQENPIGPGKQPMYKPWEASAEFILSVFFKNRATIQKSDIHDETDPGKRLIKIVRLCQKNRPLDLAGSRVIAGTKSHECTLIPNHPSMAGINFDSPDWYDRFVEMGQSTWKEPIGDWKVLKELFKKVFEEEKGFKAEFLPDTEERRRLRDNFLNDLRASAVALSKGKINLDQAKRMKPDELFKFLADKMPYDEFVQLASKHLQGRKESLTEKELSWFDSYTVQLIPVPLRQQFAQSMVTFADSNYPEVVTSASGRAYSDVMFLSYGVSPRTGQPMLFFTNNNMKYMKAVVAKFSAFTEVIKLPATAEKQQRRYQAGISEAEKEHIRKKERAKVEKVFVMFHQELMKYVDDLSRLEGREHINMAHNILELLKKLNETTEETYEDDLNFCVDVLERLSSPEEVEHEVELQQLSFTGAMDTSAEVFTPQVQEVGHETVSLAMPIGPDDEDEEATTVTLSAQPSEPKPLSMPSKDQDDDVAMAAKQEITQEKQAPVSTHGPKADIFSLRQTVDAVFSSLSQRFKGWFS